MIKDIINKAKKNPLIAFGWTVFTFSIAYLVNHEISFPDRADYFEKANIEISVSQMEYDRAVNMIDVYRESQHKIVQSIESMNTFIDNKFPHITGEDAKRVRTTYFEARLELTKVLALLRNARFDNPSFSDLVRTLESDAVFQDGLIAKRIEFLDLILTDFEKAREMKPSMELGVEDERKILEISAREPLIEYTLERARQEFNAKLRTAQRKEKVYKYQSKAAVAAGCYIGGFLGAWLGYLNWLRRKKRAKAAR